ncbi:DNA-binding protein [Xenorhabdus thuongxuanensis]|uniref:DNA-binding protein n=1 Tax=Xenorhabdus thuongxuanensis TaxID=1873484 RepID=A0A1Q5U3W1_9GAMM|nr:DNA-binding protein [Xenorhabdus thuongxuanensis]OKP07159.1 DNA-binding protein [Xenorhabdus thuongxuanensis]
MKNIIINYYVTSPYVSIGKYAELSGIPENTCRGMVNRGEIIIRPKIGSKGKIQVNMIAMLQDAIANG